MQLEQPHFEQEQATYLKELEANKEDLINRLWELSRTRRGLTEGETEFGKFVRTLYKIHKSGVVSQEDIDERIAHKLSKDWNSTFVSKRPAEWNFGTAAFFVLTTLTTIGIYCTILVKHVL